jgi:hypothetical protein
MDTDLSPVMNTKDFIRLCVPLGEATRRATNFVGKFIRGGGCGDMNSYFTFSRLYVKRGAVAQPNVFCVNARDYLRLVRLRFNSAR